MPPAARNKDGLTRALNALYDRESVSLRGLEPGQDEIKIVNGFVIFAFLNEMLASDEFLVDARSWWNQHPAFVSLDTCVPSRSTQRVLVNLCARTLWPHQEPSMRRHFIFRQYLEVVLGEEFWRLILIQHVFGHVMIF